MLSAANRPHRVRQHSHAQCRFDTRAVRLFACEMDFAIERFPFGLRRLFGGLKVAKDGEFAGEGHIASVRYLDATRGRCQEVQFPAEDPTES